MVTDNFIPPPYMFSYSMTRVVKPAHMEYSDIPLHQLATAFPLPGYAKHCNYIQCEARVGGGSHAVGLCRASLRHILAEHSVCNESREAYGADRERNSFKIGVGKGIEKSAFIARDLVLPLILSTIQNPDNVTHMSDSDRYCIERRFDVEIGHTFESCCYVNRLIVNRVSDVTQNFPAKFDTHYYEIASAYPVSAYYHKFR